MSRDDDYFMPDYCPECHGTLAYDGKHLFSAPYCSEFLFEDRLNAEDDPEPHD